MAKAVLSTLQAVEQLLQRPEDPNRQHCNARVAPVSAATQAGAL